MMIRFLIVGILFCALPFTVAAQEKSPMMNMNRDKPLEITADETLEWHRNTKQYIARGQAMARQGDVEIHADTLTADYQETNESDFEIYRLTAAGNVKILSRGSTVTGDQAVYNVDSGVAIITGNNLQMISPEQTVTAEDSFEYYMPEGRLTAIGNAYVVRAKDTIRADKMSAFFKENAQGKNEIIRMTADRNVVITTPTEVLTGDYGEYIAATEMATVIGNVKITRGPNVLEGKKAEVNLVTSISKIYGGSNGNNDGRVRGIFYPGSEKNKKEGQTAVPAQNQTSPTVPKNYELPAVTINPLPSLPPAKEKLQQHQSQKYQSQKHQRMTAP